MAVDIDYYALLGIARNADAEAIEVAVRKAMREWRKRTAASDQSVRHEAEVKVSQIERARTTLLDSAKRARYDRELEAGVKQEAAQTPVVDSGNGQSWLERAEGYLAIGDYRSAAYAAREATHVEGQNAKTWWIRSRANAGLGLWQDALYEATQATERDDGNGEYHFHLGSIHEQMNAYAEAITEYRRAGTCDPSNPMYELAVGGVFASSGKPEQALPVIEAVYKEHPQDPAANYYLGSVLIQLAEAVPASKTRDGYIVKSDQEIRKMRDLCRRAKGLTIVDSETRAAADHILRYLDEMEVKSFRPPWALFATSFAGGPLALLGCCALLVFLSPIMFVIQGFGAVGASHGASLLLVLLGAAIAYGEWKLLYIPKWKQNKRGV